MPMIPGDEYVRKSQDGEFAPPAIFWAKPVATIIANAASIQG
jgi:hypothetical protein